MSTTPTTSATSRARRMSVLANQLEFVPVAGKYSTATAAPTAQKAAMAAAAVMEGESRSLISRMKFQVAGNVATPLIPSANFKSEELTEFHFGEYGPLRKKILAWMAEKARTDPVWKHQYGLTKEQYRELTNKRLVDYVAQAFSGWNSKTFVRGDYITHMITPAYFDPSLATKLSVHAGLFCGSLGALTSSALADEIISKAEKLETRCCFAMTELGHGSNVRELETTATYIPATDELEIHTPTDSAQKIWIGHASEAHWALLFVTLIVNGVNYGIHAVMTPLRDEKTNELLPGVIFRDNGTKLGLNGVDNGRLWFNKVRVPRTNLCERFGSILPNGTYSSPISSNGRRFAAMLGGLVGGRVTVAQHSLAVTAVGLSVAIRHALQRKQFGPPGQPEVPLMFYLTHQRRLLIPLAKLYALQSLSNHNLSVYHKVFSGDLLSAAQGAKEVHVTTAGLKSVASWFMLDTLQKARECLGGQGFIPHNRIGALRADADIYATYEGDNTVLMQQVAKDLLDEFKKNFDSPSHIVTFLQSEVTRTLVNKNPFSRRFGGRAKLRSEHFQLSAIRYREHRLLKSLTARMTQLAVGGGLGAFHAWNQCLDLVQEVGRAHTERLALEHFIDAIKQVPEGETRNLLELLRSLYGLSLVEENLSLFLRYKFFNGFVADNIRFNVNSLLSSISGYSEKLVEGLGIADPIISAAILDPERFGQAAPEFD